MDSEKKEDNVATKFKCAGASGTRETQKSTQRFSTRSNEQSSHTCASCGGEHSRSSCHFCNIKCWKCSKLGHIAKVCCSTAAVVTVNKKDEDQDIPPIFQTVYLPQLDKHLHLIVNTASPLTFINLKNWQDLQKPKLEPTTRVLGAFEGQSIKPIGYFQTEVVQQDDPSHSAVVRIYVSRCGINLIGHDSQGKLHITIKPERFGRVTATNTSKVSLQEIITMNDALFKPQLGCCNTFKATLSLCDGA